MLKIGSVGLVVLVPMLVFAAIGGYLWPYTIETIGDMFGKTVEVAFWQGALIGFVPFVGNLTIPGAVIVWILTLFI